MGDLFAKSTVIVVVFLFILLPGSIALALGTSEQPALLVAAVVTALLSGYILILEGRLKQPATVTSYFLVGLESAILRLYWKIVHPAKLRTR